MCEITSEKPGISRWWILVLVHVSMVAFACVFQTIPPILDILIRKIGITYTQAGMLMGLFTLPGIFLALPGGILADRLGSRGIALLSLALLTSGTFLMIPLTPAFLYAGRLFSGIGAAFLTVVSPLIIASRFRGKELGLAMGIFNTAVPLGTVLALNLFGWIADARGIITVILVTGGFSFAALSAVFLFLNEPEKAGNVPPVPVIKGITGLGKQIWFIMGTWALFNIAVLSFFTFGIDYFTGCGYSRTTSGFLSSVPMLFSIPAVPVVGYMMDRYGWRSRLLMAGGVLCSLATFLITYNPAGAIFWALLLGAGISLIPPAVFTMIGENSPGNQIGLTYGMLTTIFNLGIFVGIPVLGAMRDYSGRYTSSFTAMAVIFLLGGMTGILTRGGIKTIASTE